MTRMSNLPRLLACLALLLPAACNAPDYTPVRGWAEHASLAVSYPAAAVSLRAAAVPAPEAPPGGNAPPPANPVQRVGDDAVLAMQEALVIWFVALATLSGDGTLTYRESPMPAIAARAAQADPGAAEAMTRLGAQLRHHTRAVYRAPEMRAAVAEADPSVQRILTGLGQRVAGAGAAPAAAEARDGAALEAARAHYLALLREVGEGHAMLARRASRINGDEAVFEIRRAEDALRRAIAARPTGLGLPPPPPPPVPAPPPRRGWFW